MSRTRKTDPVHVKARRFADWQWRGEGPLSAWFYANRSHRRARREAKLKLSRGEEPEPHRPRHEAKYWLL